MVEKKTAPAPKVEPAKAPEVKRMTVEEAAAAAKKAQEDSAQVEAEAHKRAGQINANLAKEGSSRRIMGGVRGGKPAYFWGSFVPTQALTDEELEAVGGV